MALASLLYNQPFYFSGTIGETLAAVAGGNGQANSVGMESWFVCFWFVYFWFVYFLFVYFRLIYFWFVYFWLVCLWITLKQLTKIVLMKWY